jgi:hypothetical protein
MKGTVKIIDFGLALFLNNKLGETDVGSPQNMDPRIIEKLINKGKLMKLADICSLGSKCYEILISRAVFDAEDVEELVMLIEKSDYQLPSGLSREVVSFLNGMLQYDSTIRLSSFQLVHHRFLTGDINTFHKINLTISLNVQHSKNQTIWDIFNEEDAKKLNNISPAQIDQNQSQKNYNPMLQPKNSVIPDQSTRSTDELPIKSFNTYDNVNYPNMNNINYTNQSDNPNYGPILPKRDNNPHYVNQKFDNEINYTFSGGIFDV